MNSTEKQIKYTCNEYREEMQLLALRNKLAAPGLSDKEKQELKKEIKKIEKAMDLE